MAGGGLTLMALGGSVGMTDESAAGRWGMTSCEETSWASDSSLACRVAAGSGGSAMLVATAGQQSGSLTRAMSFDGGAIVLLALANAGSLGGDTLSLVGSEFSVHDQSASQRVGATGCESSVWVSTSQVYCRLSQGISMTSSLVVTSSTQVASQTEAFSYDREPMSVDAGTQYNAPTLGSTVAMAVMGSGTGHWDTSVSAALGRTASHASTWISDSSVEALRSSGSGRTSSVVVTAVSNAGTLTEFMSFDAPRISDTGTQNHGVEVSQVMLMGGGLGMWDTSHTARVGETGAEMSAWISDSAVQGMRGGGAGSSR
eukprot:292053-Rhodomonas_salina.1